MNCSGWVARFSLNTAQLRSGCLLIHWIHRTLSTFQILRWQQKLYWVVLEMSLPVLINSSDTHTYMFISLVAEPVIVVQNCWLSATSHYRIEKPRLFPIWRNFSNIFFFKTEILFKSYLQPSDFKKASRLNTHTRNTDDDLWFVHIKR